MLKTTSKPITCLLLVLYIMLALPVLGILRYTNIMRQKQQEIRLMTCKHELYVLQKNDNVEPLGE